MPTKQKLKRYFITAIISSLIISAFIGISVILLGTFGSIESQILLTTLAVGVFSITSLANLRNLESERPGYNRFASISIACSLLALLFMLSLIWLNIDDSPWQPALVFTILAVSTAHASLLLPARKASAGLSLIVAATLACIAFVAGFLINLVLSEGSDFGETFYRLLGVVAILDVLGTILVPILARIQDKSASGPTNTPSMPSDLGTQV